MSNRGRAKAKAYPAVMHRHTKESRRAEREKVGPLSQLVVQPKTKSRYEESYEKFCKFHQLRKDRNSFELEKVDDLASSYIEFLWEDGAPKSEASYALAALQFFQPQTKNRLVWAWKLFKTWNQIELPNRATPLSPEILLAMAGQAFKWKQFRFGWLLVVGFGAFLRTSELVQLKRKVVLPQTLKNNEAVLMLDTTKGTKKNFLPIDKVVLEEKLPIQALNFLCQGLQPGDSLSQLSNSQFRLLFKDILEALHLDGMGYMPYSLRRGGVTSAFRQGVPLDTLVTQGRWQHIPTARIYIDAGLQALTTISHPPKTLSRCAALRAHFRSVSQTGARGKKAMP